jgi:hypothetical protein
MPFGNSGRTSPLTSCIAIHKPCLLFRYYDPRVLRVYLPSCRPSELETVFGPVVSVGKKPFPRKRESIFHTTYFREFEARKGLAQSPKAR